MKNSGSLEAPNTYICSNERNCYGTPVVFGDMKLHDLELTIYETGLYCSTSCLTQTGLAHQSPVYIGMLCSRSHLALHVYIEDKYLETNVDEHECGKF